MAGDHPRRPSELLSALHAHMAVLQNIDTAGKALLPSFTDPQMDIYDHILAISFGIFSLQKLLNDIGLGVVLIIELRTS